MDELLDPEFPKRLDNEPLKAFFTQALASASADDFEISLRQHMMQLLTTAVTNTDSSNTAILHSIGSFWQDSLRLCCHVVATEADLPSYQALNARRVPLYLLEDCLETLALHDAKTLWNDFVEPMFPILFSDTMWKAANATNPCSLPWLKLCQTLLRRLSSDPVWTARIMMVLAQVYPLSERSAILKWGSRNTETVAMVEEDAEPDGSSGGQNANNTKPDNSQSSTVQYNIYQSFWSLQQDFASATIQDLKSFTSRMTTVLDVLQTRNSSNNGSSIITTDSLSLLSTKYLVSRRLLPIQLDDEQFRTCFLSQFLILAHHILLEAPMLRPNLGPLQGRAKQLMPPEHLRVLEGILGSSEMQWRQWKKDKCPDLETKVSDVDSKKRKRENDNANGSSISKPSPYARFDFYKDLPDICRNMKRLVPSAEDHLEEYIEALDPESGIEAEYHPKNNSFFNWQALRLLSYRNLNDFALVHPNGDFESMVRHVWQRDKGIVIPGTAPEYPDDGIDLEERPVENDNADENAPNEAMDEENASLKESAADAESQDEETKLEDDKDEMEVVTDEKVSEPEKDEPIAEEETSAENEKNTVDSADDSAAVEAVNDEAMEDESEAHPEPEAAASAKVEDGSDLLPKVNVARNDGREREHEPDRPNTGRGRGRPEGPGNRRGGNVDNHRRFEDRPFEGNDRGGGRRDDTRRPLDQRWQPSGRRDDRGGPRRDERGPGGGRGGGRGPSRGRR